MWRRHNRFNVAASLMTRKPTRQKLLHGRRVRFNVAASLMTRKRRTPVLQRRHRPTLQCGRVVEDAETSYSNQKHAAHGMGFNVAASLMTRKRPSASVERWPSNALQCGRVVDDAETTTAARSAAGRTTLQCGRV